MWAIEKEPWIWDRIDRNCACENHVNHWSYNLKFKEGQIKFDQH